MLVYSRFDTAYKAFARWFSYLAGVALAAVTIVCFVDVIGSKFFGTAIPSQFDIIANLNLVMVFLAVFYVQMDRGSVAIELLQDHFPKFMKLSVRVFGSVLGLRGLLLLRLSRLVLPGRLLDEPQVGSGRLALPHLAVPGRARARFPVSRHRLHVHRG